MRKNRITRPAHGKDAIRIRGWLPHSAGWVTKVLLISAFAAFIFGCKPKREAVAPQPAPQPRVEERVAVEPTQIVMKLVNPLPVARNAAPIVLKLDAELASLLKHAPARLDCSPDENLPFQLDDLNQDGLPDELFFQLDLGVSEERIATLTISPDIPRADFPKKVDAIVGVAGERVKIPRAGIESELMAYSLYPPVVIDCIGKTKPTLSLQYFFGKEPHSPHQFSEEYGQDFMPVGFTLGAGGIFLSEDEHNRTIMTRPWTKEIFSASGAREFRGDTKVTYTVISDGPIRAIVKCHIADWRGSMGEYEADIFYSIAAGERHCTADVNFTKVETESDSVMFGVGFRKLAEEELYHYSKSYALATAEKVYDERAGAVVAKLLGLALVYRSEDFHSNHETPQDGKNHIILFDIMKKKRMKFFACAAWDKDEGIISPYHWRLFVRQLSLLTNNPVIVKIQKKETE